MEADEIELENTCADLLAARKYEAFPQLLLGQMRAGEWVVVADVCRQLGLAQEQLGHGVFATWIADPSGAASYAVVMFFDAATGWSMMGRYNRSRLIDVPSPRGLAGTEVGDLLSGTEAVR